MNSPSNSIESCAPVGPRHARAILIITVITMFAHGWSLTDGLFLDDHIHQLKLREAQWSFADLLASTTIEPARFIHAWWQDKTVRWDYSRPLAMAWMKAVQTVGGDRVWAQHLSNIVWHLACCMLIYCLCFHVTRKWFWSLFAAVVFCIYPHNAYAVSWLAAQNAIMQTTLTLAALLCYIKASGIKFSAAREPDHAADDKHAAISCSQAIAPLKVGTFVLAAVIFSCSLFVRECGVLFPVLAIMFDLAFGGTKQLRARAGLHFLLLGIAGVFVFWRLTLFENYIPSAYLRRPDDWSYVPWYAAKLLHYLACVIWQAPLFVGPMRYKNPFVESTGDCILMMAILVIFGGGYFVACRKIRGFWIWPAWILFAVLPMVPFFATPHMAYMPGAAFVIALVLKPARGPIGQAKLSKAVALGMLTLSVMAFSVYRVCWRGVIAGEQHAVAQVTSHPPPTADAEVFLINLPISNIYLPLNLQASWGLPASALRTHVLTMAPHLLTGPAQSKIEQIDAYSFVLSIEGQSYFSGLLGRLLAVDMREKGQFQLGEVIESDLFKVKIMDADERGVRRLKFTFREPLAGEKYRFYTFTDECPGAAITFQLASTVSADIANSSDRADISRANPAIAGYQPRIDCVEIAGADQYRRRSRALFEVMDITSKIVRTELYLTRQRSDP